MADSTNGQPNPFTANQTQSNDTSETATEDSPTQEPPLTLLVTSNTHLGRITYQLTSLPSLYVFPVTVVAMIKGQPTKVRSEKLRYQALQEYTTQGLEFAQHLHNLCIRIGNGNEPYNVSADSLETSPDDRKRTT
jgi:hypothetical protein